MRYYHESVEVAAKQAVESYFEQHPTSELQKEEVDKIVKDYLESIHIEQGADGKSAYQIWLDLGNTGTEQDFIESLAGQPGQDGQDGQDGAPGEKGEPGEPGQNGQDGVDGVDGKSAYQTWLDLGNTGTEQDFIDSLKGEAGQDGVDGQSGEDGVNGKSAYELWIDAGNQGTEEDFLNSLKGADGVDGLDGQSAYELWLQLGNEGTEEDFIASLNGEDGQTGADGQSAYEIWLAAGNQGTEEDFLNSLKGEAGQDGEPGEKGETGRSIASANINDNGVLVLSYSDGNTEEVGTVKGADGTSVNILDDLASTDELPDADQQKGDSYLINGELWVYTASTADDAVNGFINAGSIKGPAGRGINDANVVNGELVIQYSDSTEKNLGSIIGPQGEPGEKGEPGQDGAEGKSAYQIWLDSGNQGTEEDFLNSLKGQDGEPGEAGEDGENGQSAYDTWIAAGNEGTEQDFLDSLKGESGQNGTDGQSAYDMWLSLGNTGSEQDFLDSLRGEASEDGKSAYQIWLDEGNEGTEQDFLNSLKGEAGEQGQPGEDGQDGKSAYDIWKEQGNDGSEEDFLNSLRGQDGEPGEAGQDGQDGKSSYQIWLDAGNTGSEEDFLNSLKGEKGADGTMTFEDLSDEQKESLKGADGKSAYQIWLDAGNEGTEEDFLNSLVGESGENGAAGESGSDGLSAYEIWINEGNSGSEQDFLNSLKGENGQDGFSPVVTVTDTDNGHKVSIQDAQELHEFEVTDGKVGKENTKALVSNAQNFKLDITKNNSAWFGFFTFSFMYGTTPCEISFTISDKVYYTITKGQNVVSAITYTQSEANYQIGIDFTTKMYGTQVVEMPSEFGTINSLTNESYAGTTNATLKLDGSRTYTTLAELGLAASATLTDVIKTLPVGGEFTCNTTDFTNYQTLFPYEEEQDGYATIRIEKGYDVNGSRTIVTWVRKDASKIAYGGLGSNNAVQWWNQLAMKSDLGEIYSTDEQVIGTWIDGTPLCRKVISLSNIEAETSTTTVKLGEAPVNQQYIVKIEGYMNLIGNQYFINHPNITGDDSYIDAKLSLTGRTINLTGTWKYPIGTGAIIIEYLKS